MTVLAVWLVNINSTLDPLRARIAVQENFRVSSMHQKIHVVIVSQARTQQTVDHTANCVRNIRTLPTEATALVIVYVRQVGQESMQIVLAVWLENINAFLDLRCARIAEMESIQISSMHQRTRAELVPQAHTQQTVDHTACFVLNTHTLPSGARALVIVRATLDGQERMINALLVWLVNSNPILDLWHVLIVEQANFRTL